MRICTILWVVSFHKSGIIYNRYKQFMAVL